MTRSPTSESVVSYRNSTSNHNAVACVVICFQLYLIEILHQTTTMGRLRSTRGALYLIEILHQTTTRFVSSIFLFRCILSKFYIKPQRSLEFSLLCFVVSYRNSTSNHNNVIYQTTGAGVVSYRNSTSNHNSENLLMMRMMLYLIEILHQTTTQPFASSTTSPLYLIEILHQTTTLACVLARK